MIQQIIFPEFAEDGDEKARVVKWHIALGESVEEGDEVVDLLTDKAVFTVPAPCSGKLKKQLIKEGVDIGVGTVLGEIEHG